MDHVDHEHDVRSGGRRRAGNADVDSVFELFASLAHEIPGMWNDRVELVALELQRAGSVLLRLVWSLLAFALLGMTFWLSCCVGLAWALVDLGWHWAWVLLLIAAIHALALTALRLRIAALVPGLSLPASARSLIWPGTETPDAARSE